MKARKEVEVEYKAQLEERREAQLKTQDERDEVK